MSEIIPYKSEIARKNGKKLSSKIPVYRDLSKLMEYPEFVSFVDKYFNNWTNAQTIIMMIKTYEKLSKETNLQPSEKIHYLDKMLKDPQIRQLLVSKMKEFTDEKPKKRKKSKNTLKIKELE